MLYVPLKKQILISTNNAEFICVIEYAGNDILEASDVSKRIYFDNGDFTDVFLSEKFYFDRSCVLGYTNYEKVEPINFKKEKPKLLLISKRKGISNG